MCFLKSRKFVLAKYLYRGRGVGNKRFSTSEMVYERNEILLHVILILICSLKRKGPSLYLVPNIGWMDLADQLHVLFFRNIFDQWPSQTTSHYPRWLNLPRLILTYLELKITLTITLWHTRTKNSSTAPWIELHPTPAQWREDNEGGV